jgi:hypothetical protein
MLGHICTLCFSSYANNFSKKADSSTALSRTIDHINLLLRPKGDQQFSHSLSEKQTLRTRDPEKTNGGFALFADIRFFVNPTHCQKHWLKQGPSSNEGAK